MTPSELNTPLAPLPPGVSHSSVNPFNSAIIAINALCLTVTTLAITGRVITKLRVTRNIGWDDYTSVLAWFGYVVYTVLASESVRLRAGYHEWDVSLGQVSRLLEFLNITQILYGPVIFMTKLSILLQYLRIFVPTRQGNAVLFYAIHLVIWSNLVFYIVDTFVEIFECLPREKIWNPLVPGHCLNIDAAFIATAIINVISDFSIFVLPLYSIWHLKISLRQKLGVTAIFAFGLFASVTSVVRLVYSIRFIKSKDMTYSAVPLGLWALAEIGIGIVCGCLPVLPRFFQYVRPKITSRFSYGSRSKLIRSTPSKFSKSQASKAQTLSDSLYDSHEHPKASYYPLQDLGLSNMPLSETRGGDFPYHSHVTSFGNTADVEKGISEDGIQRTVRIETQVDSVPTNQSRSIVRMFKGVDGEGQILTQ